MSRQMELRFIGQDIRPENVRAGQVGDLLKWVEDMIVSVVNKHYSTLSKDDLVLWLAGIHAGSLSLKFESQIPDIVCPAFEEIGARIASTEFLSLPSKALESLSNISRFTHRYGCTAQLINANNGVDVIIAEITPGMEVIQAKLLSGETTIYGQVIRVGGRDPRVVVETVNGHLISCEIKRDMASALGRRLYDEVGLYGIAQWERDARNLVGFRVIRITTYQKLSALQAFSKLSETVGEYYQATDDVEAFVNEVRYGGEEE